MQHFRGEQRSSNSPAAGEELNAAYVAYYESLADYFDLIAERDFAAADAMGDELDARRAALNSADPEFHDMCLD